MRPSPAVCALVLTAAAVGHPQVPREQLLLADGRPAVLEVRAAGSNAVRITLRPVDVALPSNPALASGVLVPPAFSLRSPGPPTRRTVNGLSIEAGGQPLVVTVTTAGGSPVQQLTFDDEGRLAFAMDGNPVLGLGGGGPRPQRGRPWRDALVEFDRRGRLHAMEPRWQSDMYGSRNPSPMLVGTGGWALFVAAPWGQVDLRDPGRGLFLPWTPGSDDAAPQNQRNQQESLGKGLPPPETVVPGLYDVFVFDAHDPALTLRDFSVVTGPAAMPPQWALGYMQSHRTIENDRQLLEIIDTFRTKRLPLDAVIYLGTGFSPQGWNTRQPSFDFNPAVFTRDPAAVIADMHARHVRVVVHMVPWDRDRLPTLHGTIPSRPGETVDASHLQQYWAEHLPLVRTGVDAFWPDEGDWFNLYERLARHRLYYEGPLSARPDERPWSLHRNGYPGISRWGGWVWSGDTESSWKTLQAQIAVGLNYSLSIGPYWGSDIGGFYANRELTGELYARWFQFAAFCGSFRAHGRTWWTRLPWGWGLDDMGPREHNNTNAPIPADDRRNILPSELNNPAIEPIARRYAELRYQLLPYTYTLARQARDDGLPLMRALWLHYPDDLRTRSIGDEYLWGRDLLIAPVYEKGAQSRDVYLPAGDWYDWWTHARVAGGGTVTRAVDLATMPIYVRAGAIVPVDPVRQYTGEPVDEPTTLRVYRGADGAFTLYEDDGVSQAYLSGGGRWTRMRWHEGMRRLVLEPGAGAAPAEAAPREFRVRLLPDGIDRTLTYRGRRIEIALPAPAAPPGPAPLRE